MNTETNPITERIKRVQRALRRRNSLEQRILAVRGKIAQAQVDEGAEKGLQVRIEESG